MIRHNLTDTIAAITTPLGESGIGIVRISGTQALEVADKVFTCKSKKIPSGFKTYTTHYGWIMAGGREVVDEVILTVMRAPKSYTREDVVEINCHGGIMALRRALDLVLENGCRLAEPGEFTKRAFLNGRIDLAQAEAVLDIIRAKTDYALRVGEEQLKGALSFKINRIRDKLLEALTALEAGIDFPEEEITPAQLATLRQRLEEAQHGLEEISRSSRLGRVLREGLSVVICGRPNSGKSSLLNALLKQERSIVTPIAGTTRDTIEETLDIKGIPARIVDTAGILKARGLIEKKALQRTNKSIALADLVILLFDGSCGLNKADLSLIKKLRKKTVLAVINKIDLQQRLRKEKILKAFSRVIEISAKKTKGLDLLEEAIAGSAYQGLAPAAESILVCNMRHIQELKRSQKLIGQAIVSLDDKLSVEFIAQDIKDALSYLDRLLGKEFSEDLLDKIFADFCIGK
ncbi:MAG: tRNA uridine-5-carboxymethylaminomethyl(34) synthesis GTPase MnmE [Candidatus Omnitrophica bacterium]|nr:tRNA uridine-5-carboxymethylaminomethyl(34) synthesis GTPase MnmE [Candidatus Omnitrophota bacterium]